MDLREVGCVPGDWTALAEDRDQWRTYVRAVINFRLRIRYFSLLHHHQSVLSNGRSFTASAGPKAAVLPKAQTHEPRLQF